MTENEELVERLVRLADGGPEIPADGAARIKSAVKPLWEQEVSSRASRRRLLWGAGALAAAAAVAIAVRLIPHPQPDVPLLRTDAERRFSLTMDGGQSLRLDFNTTARLLASDVVELERGAVYIDSERAPGVEVRTRFGVIRDIGTQFEVRAGESLIVRVREGKVSFSDRSGSVVIDAGNAMTVDRASRAMTRIAPDAAEWEWVQFLAPPFEIEGRPVVALLDWVKRETGLQVHYESPEAEKIARTAILHGSIEQLTPAEAAETILPTAGLRVTREGNTLKVGLSR